MAEQRTLPATPRRRQKAREQGQVAFSPELGPALGLLAATLALGSVGRIAGAGIVAWATRLWAGGPLPVRVSEVSTLLRHALLLGAAAVAPVALAALVVGIGAAGAQTGFAFSTASLTPKLDAINPIQGLQRLFSARALADLLRALLKFAAVLGAVYGPANALIVTIPSLAGDVQSTAARVWGLVLSILTRAAVAMLVVAAADVFYQRWELDRSLRMSPDEMKEEMRETEGDPVMRGLRRRRQREMARRRMMADVPRADVVITNPTHYAVAIRYAPRRMQAPLVVAKGRGWLAERIKQVASAAGVVISENPPLARELYRSVPVGRFIPPSLYKAVAEVLAFVWRVKGRTPASAGLAGPDGGETP